MTDVICCSLACSQPCQSSVIEMMCCRQTCAPFIYQLRLLRSACLTLHGPCNPQGRPSWSTFVIQQISGHHRACQHPAPQFCGMRRCVAMIARMVTWLNQHVTPMLRHTMRFCDTSNTCFSKNLGSSREFHSEADPPAAGIRLLHRQAWAPLERPGKGRGRGRPAASGVSRKGSQCRTGCCRCAVSLAVNAQGLLLCLALNSSGLQPVIMH